MKAKPITDQKLIEMAAHITSMQRSVSEKQYYSYAYWIRKEIEWYIWLFRELTDEDIDIK